MIELYTDSETGVWATKDNSMIFSNRVVLCEETDARLYHLVDKYSLEEMRLAKPITEYIVRTKLEF